MKTQTCSSRQLKTLLPVELTVISPKFKENIARNGIIQPLAVCSGMICDGHQRLKAAVELGIEQVDCIEVTGIPGLLFASLNSNKELSAYEAAAIFVQLTAEAQQSFLSLCGLSDSPQMRFTLSFIAEQILPQTDLLAHTLPINVWRELGHLDQHIARFARPLLQLPGTTGEKRNIAALLRQIHRRNELPATLPGTTAAEVTAHMQSCAQPRRSAALDKFNSALAEADLPPGTSIKIDPTLAQPGMQITVNVTRRNTQRLMQVKDAVEQIFARVEEL